MNTTIDQDLVESNKCSKRLHVIIHTLKHGIDYEINPENFINEDEEEDGDVIRAEYLGEALELIRHLEELSAYIDYKIRELDGSDSNKLDYVINYDKLNERINDLKIRLREAQLISRRNELAHINKAREALCYKGPSNTEDEDTTEKNTIGHNNQDILDDSKMKELTTEDKMLMKNKTITQSLQTSHQLLQATLMQSDLNINELETSSKNLVTLHDKYSFFNDILLRTNGLVKQINASSNKERRDIYRALAVFALSCLWVLWRRILRKPVKLMFWIFFKMVSVVFWGIGKTKSSSKVDIVAGITGIADDKMTMIMNTVSTAVEVVATTTSSSPLSIETTIEDIVSTVILTSDIISQTDVSSVTEVISSVVETAVSIIKDEL